MNPASAGYMSVYICQLGKDLKKLDNDGNATDVGDDQNMSVLAILGKIKKNRNYLKEAQRSYKRWQIMKKQELN